MFIVQTKLTDAKSYMKDTSETMLEDNKLKCQQVEEQCVFMQEELVKEVFSDVEVVSDPNKSMEVPTPAVCCRNLACLRFLLAFQYFGPFWELGKGDTWVGVAGVGRGLLWGADHELIASRKRSRK